MLLCLTSIRLFAAFGEEDRVIDLLSIAAVLALQTSDGHLVRNLDEGLFIYLTMVFETVA